MYEKDRVFPSEGKHFSGPIRCQYNPRPFWPMLVYFAWTYLTVSPLLSACLNAGMTSVLIIAVLLALALLMMNKLVEITTISKGSGYGCKDNKSNAKSQ